MLTAIADQIKRTSLKAIVTVSLIFGTFYISVGNDKAKDAFTNMASAGVGALFALETPRHMAQKKENGDEKSERTLPSESESPD